MVSCFAMISVPWWQWLRPCTATPPSRPGPPAGRAGPRSRDRLGARRRRVVLLLGQKAGLLHQALVHGFSLLDPFHVLWPAHEGLVEGSLLAERLPVRRRPDLLEQVDVEVDL